MYHKTRIFVQLLKYLYVHPSVDTRIILSVTNDIQMQFFLYLYEYVILFVIIID